MLRVSGLEKSHADQLLFKSTSFVINTREKIALIGANGSGKSTLLKILAGQIEADKGIINRSQHFSIAYLPQEIETRQEWKTMSGGQKTRQALWDLFRQPAHLLLLDEPTNNLDYESLLWLETMLLKVNSACLIVSHDRHLLDSVTTRTLELDSLSHQINSYSGNYSWYQTRKAQELNRQWREFNEQQDRIKQLKADIADNKQYAASIENETIHFFYRAKAKKIAASAKARQTRLNRMVSQENKIEKPRQLEKARLALVGINMHNAFLIKFAQVSFSYGNNSILNDLNFELRGNSRILLKGTNGVGKTTLIKLLTGELTANAGHVERRPNLKLAYLKQEREESSSEPLLHFFLKHTGNHMNHSQARTFLHRFQFSQDDVFKPLNKLSLGERTKASLACFMAGQVELMILDEPTNHLDIETMNCLEEALKSYKGALIVVSHDRYFADKIAPHLIWQVESGKLVQNPA